MPGTPCENAKKSVEALGPGDQSRLVAELVSHLSGELNRQPRSLPEVEGRGKDIWQGVNVAAAAQQSGSAVPDRADLLAILDGSVAARRRHAVIAAALP